MELFLEFTTIVVFATLLSLLLRLFKQPLVVGYIFTGILIGPNFLNIIHSASYIDLFSKIGITILLFIVGFYSHFQAENTFNLRLSMLQGIELADIQKNFFPAIQNIYQAFELDCSFTYG